MLKARIRKFELVFPDDVAVIHVFNPFIPFLASKVAVVVVRSPGAVPPHPVLEAGNPAHTPVNSLASYPGNILKESQLRGNVSKDNFVLLEK